MRHKYKKFLKAAYINYDEDYCSNAVLRSSRPPLSEILAPATFEITLSPGEGYYWTTFYTSMANYRAPEGVTVYKEHLEGRSITPSTVDDRIINKGQGVVIRSSTNTITLTKTYSISSDDYSDNSLIGTDYLITNPGHAYALGYKDSAGVAFYRLSSTGKIRANKAYLIIEDIYLTQWRMMGNSVVHTDEYLTQWKVSGNSVVDNNAILSCGDYSDVDGKYHVKISNGVTIYDIPLTEPLRKVNDVADTIEFADGSATLTRNLAKGNMGDYSWSAGSTSESGVYRMRSSSIQSVIAITSNVLCAIYDIVTANNTYNKIRGFSVSNNGIIDVYDENYNQSNSAAAFKTAMNGIELIYELATPTTEVIQVSPFPISSTDTYTSANDTPYSSFEYKKNVEIWSCGEYNPIDGKYHILVQPQGGSIADIALDEPLRKVNNVADSIEFADGVVTVTRQVKHIADINGLKWTIISDSKFFSSSLSDAKPRGTTAGILNTVYEWGDGTSVWIQGKMSLSNSLEITIQDSNYDNVTDFKAHIQGSPAIYELATPTTETIQVPQIEDAESYSCVISQGGKAVEWSDFETE